MLAAFALAAAATVTMFANWEPSGESWGYWFFARRLADSFEAIGGGRSPLYTLWLQPFRGLLGYPTGMTAEYWVSGCLVAFSFAWLLSPSLGLKWAVLISSGWLPYLQTSEPPVQRLAFAASAAAISVRRVPGGLPIGYALMLAAAMLRGPYLLLAAGFGAFDAWRWHQGSLDRKTLGPRLSWLPLAILLVLSGAFAARPSRHPWSNAWIASTDWFPLKGHSLTETAVLGHLAWEYIDRKPGGPRENDIYFTHREVFGDGADTFLKAVRANPKAIARHIALNVKAWAGAALSISSVPSKMQRRWTPWIIVGLLLFGTWKSRPDDHELRLFLAISLAMACAIVLAKSKDRYFPPIVPLFSLGAWWLGARARDFSLRLRTPRAVGVAVQAVVVVGICGGLAWAPLLSDLPSGGLHPLQSRQDSMKAAFPSLAEAAGGCRGIMALEHNWFAAFLPDPRTRVYDIFEIPPFGTLGDKAYDGLRPERIDCLFITPQLETGLSWGTNVGLRWRGYIEPYERRLLALGAERRLIPGYGRAVLLRSPNGM